MPLRMALYFCEPSSLTEYLTRLGNATPADFEKATAQFGPRASINNDDDDEDEDDDIYGEDGEEASLSISGILSRDGPPWIARLFGIQGTAYSDILAGIAKSEANPNIKQLTLKFNSPGGDVVGVDECWQALRACSKPTIAINTGLMASAAYYIACACDKIKASAPNYETGSIGCYYAGIDDTDALEQEGMKRIKVIAADSPRKDSDITSKAGRSELQLRADAQCRAFIDRVARGRGLDYETVRTTFGQGSVMVAEDPDPSKTDAISVGMIDGLMPGVDAPGNGPKQTAKAIATVPTSEPKPVIQPAPQGQGDRPMPQKLSELLATNPEAKAEYDSAIQAAEKAGALRIQSRIDAAKPFLALQATKEGYTQAEVDKIRAFAMDAALGTKTVDSVQAFVGMVDINVESRKTTQAQTETQAQGETVPTQLDPGVATKAKATLKPERIAEITAYATTNKLDVNAALQAEIDYVAQQAGR